MMGEAGEPSTVDVAWVRYVTLCPPRRGSSWSHHSRPVQRRRFVHRSSAGLQCSLIRARSGVWQWILDYFAEDSAAVDLDVDRFPALEIQVSGVFAGYLGPDVASVFQGQLDAYLKPKIDEVVDHCLGGRTVGVKLDLDIVWTDVGVSQAVHGPDKAHDELVGRLLVEVLWAAYLLYLAVVHKDDVIRHLHRLFLVVGDQDGSYPDVFVQAAKPSPQFLADPGVEGAEGLVQQENVRLDSEGARQGHPLALAS